ncbi:MAG: hypothetical protein HYS13_13685 [Planctomycetia bacterium]|nr:hypothetical protein [Planctomycetia bacterium]
MVRRASSTRQLSDQEQTILEQLVKDSESDYGPYSEVQRDLVREDFRLQFTCPGKYVAFIDRVVSDRGKQRLKRRVLAVGDHFVEVDRKVRKLSNKVRGHPDLNYRLIDDPAVVPNDLRAG